MTKNNTLKPILGAIFSAIIAGFSFLCVKQMVIYASPFIAILWRFNFAFLIALVLMALRQTSFDFLRGKRRGILLLSAISYLSFMLLQALGLMFTTSAQAGIMFSIIPVLVAVFSLIFLKEKPSWIQWLFIFISIIALCAIFVYKGGGQGSLLGGLFLFLSSAGLACNTTCFRYLKAEYAPIQLTSALSSLGFFVLNITFLCGLGLGLWKPVDYILPIRHMEFITSVAYLGIFCIIITSMLNAYVANHLEAVKVSIFGNMSTLVSVLVGAVVLNEVLLPIHYICAGVIIISVFGVAAFGKKKSERRIENGV
jgi:drug/metabolite transporter (DMT)-like permease